MAHGTDSEEFRLISSGRSGLKREFAFAIKNQSNLKSSRGRLSQNSSSVNENFRSKRFKSSDLKEQKEIDQIDLIGSSMEEVDSKVTCMNESELDLSKSQVVETPKDDLMKSGNDDGIIEVVAKDDVCDDNVRLEKSTEEEEVVGKIDRASLKRKAEIIDVASSSGSTVQSEDTCKNEAIVNDNGRMSDAVSSLKFRSNDRMEIKMSKKVALRKFPVNVKDLFESGFLDGMTVKYLFKNKRDGGLQGIIKDGGICCFCDICKGSQVISAYNFEKHAGSSQKHPSDNTYLENGKTLRDVLIACRGASLETVEEVIKNAISSSPEIQFKSCKNCKEPLPAASATKVTPYCKSCMVANETFASPSRGTVSKTRFSKAETSKSSTVASGCAPVHKKCKGKITRKDLRLHKLVFKENGLPDGTELGYYIRGKKMVEGYKKGFSIFCRHCESEVSPSQFESHAGFASRRKPYLNIYTSNGVSLHEFSIELSRKLNSLNHENDDLCGYCMEFGDLLCCDMCPRAFHQECVGLSSIPEGKWNCPYCVAMTQRERSCAYNANAKAAGRVSGVDPIEEIAKKCIRIVETTEAEVGGCVLCRRRSFSREGFGPSTVLLCDQCEKEYHIGCLKDHNMADLKEVPEGKWFCCAGCHRIHTALQKLVAFGSEKLPAPLLNDIKKKHEQKFPDDTAEFDVSWRLLSGKTCASESRLLLSKAVTIFHEQFDPIIEVKSKLDYIAEMVYGRSVNDQEFGGMYCALLTVNSTVVSAGILRIFGEDMAEIPLVATSSANQGQGYFQSLFCCIERFLGFLNVKNIVLPSAEESKALWTDKFGFKGVPQDQMDTYKNNCPMMIFQGTSLLEKPVRKCRIVEKAAGKS